MSAPRIFARRGVFGRWYITRSDDDELAWTGMAWTKHNNGVGIAGVQVSNFAERDECEEYIRKTWLDA